jgi:hypothetical protein
MNKLKIFHSVKLIHYLIHHWMIKKLGKNFLLGKIKIQYFSSLTMQNIENAHFDDYLHFCILDIWFLFILLNTTNFASRYCLQYIIFPIQYRHTFMRFRLMNRKKKKIQYKKMQY